MIHDDNGNTQCKIQKFCRICGHKLLKIYMYKGGKRESQTNTPVLPFQRSSFTCFATDIRNDTVDSQQFSAERADVLCAKYKKQQ